MILEVAIMKIKPELMDKFEAVFPKAAAITASVPGFISLEMQRCVETKGKYFYMILRECIEAHEKNFIECVKSRNKPHSDVEIGRISTTLCHLGNICHHLKRDVRFDPKTETFGNDKEANARLTKTYRAPYTLPKV
jgi:quinol monooxygenase YgiN